MYPFTLGLVSVLFIGTALASSARYTVVSEHALQGWSYELESINRLQCLLACSRKLYCLSVNYNEQDRLCQLSGRQREEESPIGNFKQDTRFKYIGQVLDKDVKKNGIYFSSTNVTYEQAQDMCSNQLGSLASYDNLYRAFQPRMDNCMDGWLIGGEIAFTEMHADKCALLPPDQRSNVFPCEVYYSGYYCYNEYNRSLDTFNYMPVNQRIVRLTGSNSRNPSGNEADACCSGRFGSRLATPFEVYTAYSGGVNICTVGWFLGGLAGNPCVATGNTTSEFWLYPMGEYIFLRDPASELFGMCYISHPNQNTSLPDPYPAHHVVNVGGFGDRCTDPGWFALWYQDARTRCIAYGGVLATRAQLEYAHSLGYDCCCPGWVEGEEVIWPIVKSRFGCGLGTGIMSYVIFINRPYGGYCYM